MKKFVVSLLLVLSMMLTLASCGVFAKKDDPEKNIDHLVASLNAGISLEDLSSNAQIVDFDESLDDLKKTVFELDGTVNYNGKTENYYLAMKDMVVYFLNADGEENYTFFLDDLTLVNVIDIDGEYYGYADTSFKEIMDYIKSSESGAEITIPEYNETSELAERISNTLASVDLPDATTADIEYKDGKYYLTDNYVKSVLNTYIDVVLDEFGTDLGMTASNIIDAKAVIKGYLDYINVEIYYYIDREEITGVGVSLKIDETFAAEKIGYSDISVSVEVCHDKFALTARAANEDSVLVDISASYEFVTDKKDNLEALKFDVNAKIGETIEEVTLSIDLDADFVTMKKGNGEFMTFDVNISNGGEDASLTMKATSADKGNAITVELSETTADETIRSVVLNMKNNSASRMPEIPQEVIDAKDQALED